MNKNKEKVTARRKRLRLRIGGSIVAAIIASTGCERLIRQGEEATQTWTGAKSEVAFQPTVEFELTIPDVRSNYQWPVEAGAMATALIEAGLIELPGVVPRVASAEVAPGLDRALSAGAQKWRSTLEITDEVDGSVRLFWRICPLPGRCVGEQAFGSFDRPELAVAELLEWVAHELGQPVTQTMRARWRRRQSDDQYARLLCARTAAIHYGLIADVLPERIGHREADVMTRAAFIDPTMEIAQWMRARRALRLGDFDAAMDAIDRGLKENVGSPPLMMALAATRQRAGKHQEAARRWDEVGDRFVGDPRFVAPRAWAAVTTGAIDRAKGFLDELPDEYRTDAVVAELRVAIAQTEGPGDDYEQLLAAWAEAAPHDPEPIRRRIGVRLRKGELEGALELLGALEARGASAEASRFAIAIGNELGHYFEASRGAEELGLENLARRLRARSALVAQPYEVPETIAKPKGPEELIVVASLILEVEPKRALGYAQRALKTNPWDVDALTIEMRALEQLGKVADAAEVRSILNSVDPLGR